MWPGKYSASFSVPWENRVHQCSSLSKTGSGRVSVDSVTITGVYGQKKLEILHWEGQGVCVCAVCVCGREVQDRNSATVAKAHGSGLSVLWQTQLWNSGTHQGGNYPVPISLPALSPRGFLHLYVSQFSHL